MYHWQPTAKLAAIKSRAELMQGIRSFFAARDVVEVETPILARYGVTDVNLEAITATFNRAEYYLQTSPEYAMKRLLAQHRCSMFQITKAFRNDESGRFHNPEFSILEWYRVGFDHFALMREVDELLHLVLGTAPARQIAYRQLFMEFVGIDPLTATISELQQCCLSNGIDMFLDGSDNAMDQDDWLSLLLTHCIEPKLQGNSPWMVYDYPRSQAALAKINPEEPAVAQRFEVYINGIELANGYHELGCHAQHRERFSIDNKQRLLKNKAPRAADEYLLSALQAGLPACAGVALGIDRLLMLKLGVADISAVINFPINIS